MTPTAIFSAVKDILIIAAIGLMAYFLVSYGKDIVKVSDMATVQKQLQANAADVARWQKEWTDADTKRQTDLAAVASTIANQRTPVFVRGPSCPGSLPNDSGKAGNQQSGPTGSDQGRGIDYRPVINQFESKYSTALIDCYAALDKWPK